MKGRSNSKMMTLISSREVFTVTCRQSDLIPSVDCGPPLVERKHAPPTSINAASHDLKNDILLIVTKPNYLHFICFYRL